jgi:peptidoglycan/LPS O-acetylase OafA/YrhL
MSPHFIRIDALRGVAILMVMQLHIFFITFTYDYLNFPTAARYLLRSGGAGVDLFFILSAYLLTTNLLRQRDRPGVITTFFARRALRILPMFLILIFSGFAIEALWLKVGGTTDVWLWHDHFPLSTYLLFLQNWRLPIRRKLRYAPSWPALAKLGARLWPIQSNPRSLLTAGAGHQHTANIRSRERNGLEFRRRSRAAAVPSLQPLPLAAPVFAFHGL